MSPGRSPDPPPNILEELLPDPEAARRAAASDAPVLILGEPGTGRTSLARALHSWSRRAEAPLVEVDAGAVPATLFESELFGYRPGAFTGADTESAGRVGRAGGGTLVLDRVEEIPLATQPKLLRLLADGRYVPLGGEDREADVRFIAVGGDDLPRRVAEGSFREDLYYRLEVLTLSLPALRERPTVLERLIELMLSDLAGRLDAGGLRLSLRAREWMIEHPWPGNLRELRNTLERAAIVQDGPVLDPPPPPSSGSRPLPLTEVERREILRALAFTRGHQGRAAELLGISRKALWQKRRRHGIP